MPIHDWTRVGAWLFHDFHSAWMGALRNALNSGALPASHYAMMEQHPGNSIEGVLTRHANPRLSAPTRRKTLTIRHVGGDRMVALVEIVSPCNKDRREHVEEFLDKMADALRHGVHLLLVDLFPPGPRDPRGLHGALWERLSDDPEQLLAEAPLTLASYVAVTAVTAYVEHLTVGRVLPSMPLFLDPDYYVAVPLEPTYQAAWEGTPEHWRKVLEGGVP